MRVCVCPSVCLSISVCVCVCMRACMHLDNSLFIYDISTHVTYKFIVQVRRSGGFLLEQHMYLVLSYVLFFRNRASKHFQTEATRGCAF